MGEEANRFELPGHPVTAAAAWTAGSLSDVVRDSVLSINGTVARALILDPFADLIARANEAARALTEAYRRAFPPNLLPIVESVSLEAIQTLANEGITVWAVPRARVAVRLMRAPDARARRDVLGAEFEAILEDCAGAAAAAVAGPFPDLARLLEQAVRVMRSGEVAAGQALAASVLDTLLKVSFEKPAVDDLMYHHKGPKSKKAVMDHFEELEVRAAMVLRPIWFAYRPQWTAEERRGSSSFARHATAHYIRGRAVSKRNAAQAAMLAAALLDLLALLDD